MATPSPFGLEMGKTTIDDTKKRYQLESHGKNPVSEGGNFEVITKDIDFDGLQSLNITFNKEGKLVSLSAKLGKYRFDTLMKSMQAKYTLVKQEIPFVGDKYAQFKDGDTVIMLDAPHLGFGMTLMYIQADFLQAVQKSIRDDKNKKQQREDSQL
jgi:hypothetical protein